MRKTLLNSLLYLACIVLFVTPVFGDSTAPITTFAEMSTSWQVSLSTIATFIQFITALCGIIIIILGLAQMRHSNSGQQNQQGARIGLLYLVIGSVLMVSGTLIAVIANSLVGGSVNDIGNIFGNTQNNTPQNLYDGVIVYFLIPFLKLIEVLGPIIGIATLAIGCARLRYHVNPQLMSMYRRAPMATCFYFVIGGILMAPFYVISAISQSLFNTPSVVSSVCGDSSTSGNFLSYFGNLENQPIITYSNGVFNCITSATSSTTDDLIRLTYSLLFVVGFIAIIRGFYLMVKLGEHMGGGQTSVAKVIAFLIGGFCCVNANMLVLILSNTYTIITGLPTG